MTNYVNCKNNEDIRDKGEVTIEEIMIILLIILAFRRIKKGVQRRLCVSDLPFEATANNYKEYRYKEDSQQCCGDHPPHHANSHRVLRATSCSVTDSQGQYTENKSERRH